MQLRRVVVVSDDLVEIARELRALSDAFDVVISRLGLGFGLGFGFGSGSGSGSG